ncbi:MAG: DUF975 family protein [Clostridia bacterium]
MSFNAEIKKYSKQRLKPQFGITLAALILVALPPAIYGFFSVAFTFTSQHAMLLATAFFTFAFLASVGFMFVYMPVMYGGVCATTLRVSRGEKISCSLPFTSTMHNYPRKLGGIYWMHLFTFLWSLLLIIPGIVKSYAYSFTPYILAEFPNVKARDALKLSMKMTNGAKGDLFLFDLSFIGWAMLTVITFGIVGIYVAPYYAVAHASLYDSIKNNAIESGKVSIAELG